MKSALIFGAGGIGKKMLSELRNTKNIIGFLDNDCSKWGTYIDGVLVIGGMDKVLEIDYDEILLGTMSYDILQQFIDAGGDAQKINTTYIDVIVNARINFLKDFAFLHHDFKGELCVAEGGVYRGEFASVINERASFKSRYKG